MRRRTETNHTDLALCTCLLTVIVPTWAVIVAVILFVDWVVG